MAKLKLTLHTVPCYKDDGDKTPQSKRNISVYTDGDTSMLYTTAVKDGSTKEGYQLSLVELNFEKKMYQPTEVIATLYIGKESGKTWNRIEREQLKELFLHRCVSLEEIASASTKNTIGDDYYVHQIQTRYKTSGMYCVLYIYSPDKLLTLSQASRTFVSKKLASEILTTEMANYKKPFDSEAAIACDTENMRVLTYKKADKKMEHIFPYLVQYNESFYDLLARTTNRWGEFLYYEDGKLHVGYNDKPKEIQDRSEGWQDMVYCDGDQESITSDQYALEAAYDKNILDNPLKKDPDIPKYVLGAEGWENKWVIEKFSSFFSNTKSPHAWGIGVACDEIYNQMETRLDVKQANNKFNKRYFDDKTQDEHFGSDSSKWNPFSEFESKYDEKKYIEILTKELAAGRSAVRISFDTTYPNLKLGQIIKLDATETKKRYMVVGVKATTERTTPYKLSVGTELELADDETKAATSTAKATTHKYMLKKDAKIAPDKVVTQLKFEVTAIVNEGDFDATKDDNTINFYPPVLPTGHIRKSEPQVATVTDADDPLQQNRVRIMFDWQKVDKDANKKITDSTKNASSPWVVHASTASSKGSGIWGRHAEGDRVLVNFAFGNVERPFVAGSLPTDGNTIPSEYGGGVKVEEKVCLTTPGAHFLKLNDGCGAGLTAFLVGTLSPCLNVLTIFSDLFGANWRGGDAFKNATNDSPKFQGGFELGDKFGLYKISGSTDKRNVSIKSPWGDVNIDAFTGISINAPNGDVSIKGKNVTIEAGNNLKLTSGTNVSYKLAPEGKNLKAKLATAAKDAALALTKKLADKFKVVDLKLVRSAVEVVMRPMEGALVMKSNRYLKLEAGKGSCGYPQAAYKDQATIDKMLKEQEKQNLRPGLKLNDSIVELLGKVADVASEINFKYITTYNRCVDKRKGAGGFEDVVRSGNVLRNEGEGNPPEKYCKDYAALKDKLWADGDKMLTEEDLDFDDCFSTNVNDVSFLTAEHYADTFIIDFDINGDNAKHAEATGESQHWKQAVADARLLKRQQILQSVNELRKAIIELKKFENLQDKDFIKMMGKLNTTPIIDYEKAFGEAFTKAKLNVNNVETFYYTISDDEKNLELQLDADAFKEHETRLRRRASILLLEGLGFKDEWRKMPDGIKVPDNLFGANTAVPPRNGIYSDENIVNDVKWFFYVLSINSVPKLSAAKFKIFEELKKQAASLVDKDNGKAMWNAISGKERNSWGDAKEGGILFSSGKGTFTLSDNIQQVRDIPGKENLTVADDPEGKTEVNQFLNKLKETLRVM